MSEEIKTTESVKATEEKKQSDIITPHWVGKEHKKFDYADLYVWCGNCGTDNAPEHPSLINMQTALMTQTNTDNQSYIRLACKNCGSELILHFNDAKNPPSEEEIKETKAKELVIKETENKPEEKES